MFQQTFSAACDREVKKQDDQEFRKRTHDRGIDIGEQAGKTMLRKLPSSAQQAEDDRDRIGDHGDLQRHHQAPGEIVAPALAAPGKQLPVILHPSLPVPDWCRQPRAAMMPGHCGPFGNRGRRARPDALENV
ncbi:hypothetical protein D9M72_564340 [compost metagenome]